MHTKMDPDGSFRLVLNSTPVRFFVNDADPEFREAVQVQLTKVGTGERGKTDHFFLLTIFFFVHITDRFATEFRFARLSFHRCPL